MDSKVRLHVAGPLGPGQSVEVTRDQAHYLSGVMRLAPGDTLEVFDGASGGWRARIEAASKRGGTLVCTERVRPQRDPPDLWLVFAPIKKARTDFIVEKAAELGAARILPVMTEHTNSDRIRRDRLQAHTVEAAEQCGGTYVPEVAELAPLARVLDEWPEGRALVFCDEALAGAAPAPLPPPPAAILIGPEGGFSESERARLSTMSAGVPTALGPRILRADTAAVAALTLWQAARGDWT
ncbi:MAG: 16S rRNA (uracil(1498)-N(3))-methyltransferase [Pseudomonadota bacterium]